MGNCSTNSTSTGKMESAPQDQEQGSPPRPATPPPTQNVDRYGFVRKKDAFDPHENEPPNLREKRSKKEKERVEKWKVMLSSSRNPYRVVRSRQFQRRIRKGIPEPMRAQVWTRLLMDVTDEDKEWARKLFATAAAQLQSSEAGRDAMEAIRKDLGRTYPGHVQFQTEEGQAALETVLQGYAAFDIEVGYCQGMSFITALLLMYMDEAEALCVLKKLMNHSPWMMRDLFKPGMPAVALRMYQYDVILGRAASKVSKHFKHFKFETSMYATHWFATIFTYNFPFARTLLPSGSSPLNQLSNPRTPTLVCFLLPLNINNWPPINTFSVNAKRLPRRNKTIRKCY